jgi:hypothetical protein
MLRELSHVSELANGESHEDSRMTVASLEKV